MSRMLTIATLLTFVCASALQARTWTDRSGKYRIEAELIAVRDGKAYLERANGRVTTVPLDKLSIEDLKYLASSTDYAESVKPFLPKDEPAKRQAASNSAAKRVKASVTIRDPQKHGSVRRFESPGWGFEGIGFSPDGTYLAAVTSDGINVFHVNANKSVSFKVDRSSGTRSRLAFSPDGKLLLAGSRKGNVLIWNFDDEGALSPYKQFRIHKSDITSISVTPDNKHVLSMSQDNVFRVWKVETGEEVAAYDGFRWARKGTTYVSPGGGQAMVTDGTLVALFELPQGKPLQAMKLGRGIGQCVAISPDGAHIAVNDRYAMRVWQTQTGNQLPLLEGEQIQWTAVFSPNGKLLASGATAKVNIWSMEGAGKVHTFQTKPTGYVKEVAFSPDGMHVACVCGPIGKTIEIFRLPVELRGQTEPE